MQEAHMLLAKEETKPKSDPIDIATIHAFTSPRDPRTMGSTDRDKAHLLAIIAAKGTINKSTIRRRFVEDYLLISRSIDKWGSEQAASVAKARAGEMAQPKAGFSLFRRKDKPQG